MKILSHLSDSAHEKVLACQLEWDVDPIKEAKLYKTALQEKGVSQKLLAKVIGRKRTYIANVVRILSLPTEVQRLVSLHKISISHARLILSVMPEVQVRLAKECAADKWTARELKQRIDDLRPTETELKKAALSLHEKTGLVSRVQTNERGNCFIQFAFRSPSDARSFIKKLEKI